MKDGLGQELNVGDCVVWVGGRRQYAGVQIYHVIKITEKRVRISIDRDAKPNVPAWQADQPVVDPDTLVVVNELLDG